MKDLIKNIIKEEVEDKKIKLVIEFIRNIYNVSDYDNRPLVRFDFKSFHKLDGTENFITKRACDSFNRFWGGSVTIAPFWFPSDNKTYIDADILIHFWEV
jgi:hypothetical protein